MRSTAVRSLCKQLPKPASAKLRRGWRKIKNHAQLSSSMEEEQHAIRNDCSHLYTIDKIHKTACMQSPCRRASHHTRHGQIHNHAIYVTSFFYARGMQRKITPDAKEKEIHAEKC